MRPIDAFTDFGTVSLPGEENEMSRRYLKLITRWIPVGMSYFKEWSGRPNCGHFFLGTENGTVGPIMTIALATSSSEFDSKLAGTSRDELRMIALKGLRYMCFTHGTGPTDCLQPKDSSKQIIERKWGGCGQTAEVKSQCGRTIANLAITAALLKDLLGQEEHEMLAKIAVDYIESFAELDPWSGVYDNTQTEENAWTALGIVACMMLLSNHELLAKWQERAKLWMFRTSTMPHDNYDQSEFAEGKTVSELCGRTYTTLPDGTAENHCFVHPIYMAAAITLFGNTINLLRLFNQLIPPHIFWHRQDCYNLMKRWCDNTGAYHCLQGMDWPYFIIGYPEICFFHVAANLYLKDPDASLLEQRTLKTIERSSHAHKGRAVPEEVVKYCRWGLSSYPPLMWESVESLAQAYLAHRLMGEGESPPEDAEFERRMHGVYIYPHGGALLHRHAKGKTSLSWRNHTMILPATREGIKLIGPPAEGTMLAKIKVKGSTEKNTSPLITPYSFTLPVALKIRETMDRVSAVLVQDIAEGKVRREIFFASMSSGKCLIVERLFVLQDITVEYVEQGYLSIINDGYFGEQQDLRGKRHIFWDGGEQIFWGYATGFEEKDIILDLKDTPWLNVDDRFGLVFKGSGRAFYRNRHHFIKMWRAIEDELVLSLQDEPKEFKTGQQIADLVTLWCPEQSHEETANEELIIHQTQKKTFAAEVDNLLCACNFTEETVVLPLKVPISAGQPFPISWGVSGMVETDLAVQVRLGGYEFIILEQAW